MHLLGYAHEGLRKDVMARRAKPRRVSSWQNICWSGTNTGCAYCAALPQNGTLGVFALSTHGVSG
jgi:hypothetical protein